MRSKFSYLTICQRWMLMWMSLLSFILLLSPDCKIITSLYPNFLLSCNCWMNLVLSQCDKIVCSDSVAHWTGVGSKHSSCTAIIQFWFFKVSRPICSAAEAVFRKLVGFLMGFFLLEKKINSLLQILSFIIVQEKLLYKFLLYSFSWCWNGALFLSDNDHGHMPLFCFHHPSACLPARLRMTISLIPCH